MATASHAPARHSRTSFLPADAVALGYARVSTAEQARTGLGLAAQRAAIDDWAAGRSDKVVVEHHDENGASGMLAPEDRPVLSVLLDRLADSDDPASALVVSHLDRLGRSVIDVLWLMDRAQREDWSVVMLDLEVDATTATGRMIATVMAAMARMERDMTAEKTRRALAERAAAGARLGRPVSAETRAAAVRAEALAADGLSLRSIARTLTAEGWLRATGDRQRPWDAAAAGRALRSLQLDREAAAKATEAARRAAEQQDR
ncbi:recombinase family protein [Candidatus Poriferisodalis sp.]|uniref:recombinase family protein n=1 Tax=Candidatus Poriferisodalis sp. TaxID=3101277 RepID=UPI003B01DC1C